MLFHVFPHISIKSGSIYWGRRSESGILSSAPTTSRWAWYFQDPWSKIIPNYILKLARVELKSNAPFVCCLLWSLNLDYHTCHTCLMLNNSQDSEWGEKMKLFSSGFPNNWILPNFPRMERQQDRKLGRSGVMKQKHRGRYQMRNKK